MTAPLPPVDVPEPVEPGPAPGWWEESPAAAARADDRYWFDRDED